MIEDAESTTCDGEISGEPFATTAMARVPHRIAPIKYAMDEKLGFSKANSLLSKSSKVFGGGIIYFSLALLYPLGDIQVSKMKTHPKLIFALFTRHIN